MNGSTLRIGDIIVREKGIFSTHYIIYLGKNLVAENQINTGVRITSLTNALRGNAIKRIEKFSGTDTQRRFVYPRIKRVLGKSLRFSHF
jgi:hypothetical protein